MVLLEKNSLAKPILYSYFRSSCSYRVRLGLYYKAIPFEYRFIHLLKGSSSGRGQQHQEEFLKLNPKGEVPVFVHGTRKITQSYVILQYLEQQWSDRPSFYPTDQEDRLLCDQLCHVIHSGIQPLHNLSVVTYLEKTYAGSESQKKMWIQHWIGKGLEAWSNLLRSHRSWKGPYTFDETWTLADMFLVPQLFAANRFAVDLSPWPWLGQIYEEAMKRSDVQKARPEAQEDYQE
jgi:maleylacetoacetate isomerase